MLYTSSQNTGIILINNRLSSILERENTGQEPKILGNPVNTGHLATLKKVDHICFRYNNEAGRFDTFSVE